MSFDESFLRGRLAKQQEWARNGQKTGSGKPFTSTIKVIGAGGFPSLAVPTGDGRIKKAKRKADSSERTCSYHAVALAALAKNPELRTGAVVNGKKRAANHEHWEQVIIFDWLYRVQPDYYDDFAAVPMGGLRDDKTARALYAEGAKSGYPDITGDVPKGIYHGLFIELKYGSNKPSDNQIAALNRKTSRGYFAAVCYGHEEAIAVISEYLALAAGGVMSWVKNETLWKEAA